MSLFGKIKQSYEQRSLAHKLRELPVEVMQSLSNPDLWKRDAEGSFHLNEKGQKQLEDLQKAGKFVLHNAVDIAKGLSKLGLKAALLTSCSISINPNGVDVQPGVFVDNREVHRVDTRSQVSGPESELLGKEGPTADMPNEEAGNDSTMLENVPNTTLETTAETTALKLQRAAQIVDAFDRYKNPVVIHVYDAQGNHVPMHALSFVRGHLEDGASWTAIQQDTDNLTRGKTAETGIAVFPGLDTPVDITAVVTPLSGAQPQGYHVPASSQPGGIHIYMPQSMDELVGGGLSVELVQGAQKVRLTTKAEELQFARNALSAFQK